MVDKLVVVANTLITDIAMVDIIIMVDITMVDILAMVVDMLAIKVDKQVDRLVVANKVDIQVVAINNLLLQALQ